MFCPNYNFGPSTDPIENNLRFTRRVIKICPNLPRGEGTSELLSCNFILLPILQGSLDPPHCFILKRQKNYIFWSYFRCDCFSSPDWIDDNFLWRWDILKTLHHHRWWFFGGIKKCQQWFIDVFSDNSRTKDRPTMPWPSCFLAPLRALYVMMYPGRCHSQCW